MKQSAAFPPAELSWRSRVDGLLDQLENSGMGLLVTVDEVDPDLDEMTTLVTSYQHFFDEGRKAASAAGPDSGTREGATRVLSPGIQGISHSRSALEFSSRAF